MEAIYLGLVVILGIVLILLFTRTHRKVIPGYAPSDKDLGNFSEVGQAGSLHEFLCKNHKPFGPVFEFWWANSGQYLCATSRCSRLLNTSLTVLPSPSRTSSL
jgi:hypothetical protein